ncbi:MAG: HDIG domain-containing protein [Rhodothermales bacterium]|nr:HDIG domain-containing protein [Rhodothermales bacterium]
MGTSLERGTDDRRAERRRNLLFKAGLFLGLTVLTVAAFPRGQLYRYTIEVGEVWQRETLEAPFDFAIYKTPEELDEERREVRFSTPPIFEEIPDAQERMSANRDTLRQQLDALFGAYAAYRLNSSRGRLDEAREDSLRYVELRRNARVKLTNEQWSRLAQDVAARDPDLQSTTRTPPGGTPLYEALIRDAWEFSTQFINMGVMEIARDSIGTDEIIVRDERAHTERAIQKDNVYGLNEVFLSVQDYFRSQFDGQPELVNMLNAFVRAIFVPSLELQRAMTLQAWQEAESRISPTRGKIARGEEIVREGQRITEEIRRKLISLETAQVERGGTRLYWRRTLGEGLLAMATFVIFFLYLFMVRRTIFDDNRRILLMTLLFAGVIGLFALAIRVPEVGMYTVPVAIVSVLLTVIFDSRVGLFGTLTLALIGGLLLGYDFEFTFATLFGGTLGVFSVRDIKNRGQFFLSAVLVFLGYAVVMGATWLFLERDVSTLGKDLLLVLINSFLVILAYGLLWVLERAFDVTTDLTLLELSDTNRPLLKELSLRAPGTFNHALQVANLAEAAAAAIGANALLTRVGALYHDIGKMLKPEYFVENQRPGLNPHDQLKPRMSALIIASHVKEGLEMGRQYALPQRVLDFIPMHHGTTRIEYFYRKALEEHGSDDPPILESEFRYPGPRPSSKETGILMLADGVEAASRSLSEPTHKRLDALIDMIIKARIEDGQLDDTDLTFRDLRQIKETFLALLLGIYHIRVKYPGQEDRKPAKQAPSQGGRAAQGDAPRPEAAEPAASAEARLADAVSEEASPPEPESATNGQPAPPEDAEQDPGVAPPGGDGSALEGEQRREE